MFNNKYGTFLTVLLVILIVVILGVLIFLGIKFYINYKISNDSIKAIAEFDEYVKEETNTNTNTVVDTNTILLSNESAETNTYTNVTKKKYYKDFVMLGYIEIKKTGIKYPILESATSRALEIAVAVSYPNNSIQLNQPGNVVIVGHNYRNGLFFSNNKNLSTGDKIYIKDITGKTLSYTIYEIFSTTPEDASFYDRDTNGVAEITLSTCSDDGNTRLIIKARNE